MADLSGVLTIRQVTRLIAKWGCDNRKVNCRCAECEKAYERMRSHLMTANGSGQLDGRLLVNVGGKGRAARWTVTREALEQLHPQWFVQMGSLRSRVDVLEKRVDEQDEMLRAAHRDIGFLRRHLGVKAEEMPVPPGDF